MIISEKPKINWISIHDELPNDKQRCLIWDVSCHCSQDGTKETIHHIYIATFYKGEHRPNGPWRACDTGFSNNKYPWNWEDSARSWDSQYVSHWAHLPHWSEDPNDNQ